MKDKQSNIREIAQAFKLARSERTKRLGFRNTQRIFGEFLNISNTSKAAYSIIRDIENGVRLCNKSSLLVFRAALLDECGKEYLTLDQINSYYE